MQHRMKKYYLQGKEISEKQAKAIEAKNQKYISSNDISQEGYVTSTGEDYPILKVNDLSDDNAMLEFAVIGLECDILKLSFLGRIKG